MLMPELKIDVWQRKKQQQHAHTKSVASLVKSENWSKKKHYIIKQQQQYAHTESVAGLDNSENWSKKNTKKQHAHNKSVARLVDSEN